MNKTLMAIVALLFAAHQAGAQNANLKILVIAGEGAVNIIQQKTAVAPIVEIRDRNNLPVGGATVTFSIGGGTSAAFAGGAQTVTVTTNAAGRAAAAALNPLGGGSFQIQVSAAFQGQTAAATIAQTNVLTLAEAATQTAGAAGTGGAGGSSGGAAAGGASGGGLSGTTIGIIGAAVAGGALAATQVAGGSGGDGGEAKSYTGSFTGQMVFNQNSGGLICDFTRALTGTVTVQLEDGAATGSAGVSGTSTTIAVTASPNCQAGGSQSISFQANASGAPSAIVFAQVQSNTTTTPTEGGSTGTTTNEMNFSGSLSGGVITGTLTITNTANGVGSGGNVIISRGTAAMPVTLR